MKLSLPNIGQPRAERKKRSGVMLCYPYESKRLARWGGPPVFVQPKLDGERARLRYDAAGGWEFLSSTEDVMNFAVPHLIEALSRSTLPTSVHLDGELYCHGLSFEEIHSIVSRRTTLHPEHTSISYHVFDCVIPDCSQHLRLLRLQMLLKHLKGLPIELVQTLVADHETDIWKLNELFVEDGYEGIIVRKQNGLWVPRRSTEVMKFKPRQEDLYRVVGAQQEVSILGDAKQSLGALICECDGQQFAVGTGFGAAERVTLWEEFLRNQKTFTDGSLWARVKYQHITSGRASKDSKGVPRFPVFVELTTEGEEE